MIAQYYPETKEIKIFKDRNSSSIMILLVTDRKAMGFPALSKWKKTSWGGREIVFEYVVTQVEDKTEY